MRSPESAAFAAALEADDVTRAEQILRTGGASPALLNQVTCNRKPLLACSRSVLMAAKLLDFGADVGVVSQWWAPGLFVNPDVDPAVGRFLIERGATVSPHAAAGLGFVDALREILDADCSCVHEKAGDGCTPLHFARDVATAALLVEHGADMNARDEDHDSTPAQWLIRASPDVAAYLIERGATPDIFLAAALGNRSLAERLIFADHSTVAHRIGKAPWHPIGHHGLGGTILQWTLGFNRYAHQVAAHKGHDELFDFLLAESDVSTRFLVACMMANSHAAEAILAAHPGLVATFSNVDLELLARY